MPSFPSFYEYHLSSQLGTSLFAGGGSLLGWIGSNGGGLVIHQLLGQHHAIRDVVVSEAIALHITQV